MRDFRHKWRSYIGNMGRNTKTTAVDDLQELFVLKRVPKMTTKF